MTRLASNGHTVLHSPKRQWLTALLASMGIATLLLFQLVVLNRSIPQVDHVTHLRWAIQFSAGLADGMLYPRWAFASHGGLGDPTFIYYQPLFYYLVAAVDLLTEDIQLAIRASLLLSNIALGLGAFAALRRHVGHLPALLGMVFVQTLPLPLFLEAYYGALPWVFASPFVVLFALESADKRPRPHFVGAWLALLVLSHVLSALMALLSIGLAMLILLLGNYSANHRKLLRWALGVFIGLLLCAPYLYPAITQQGLINPAGWSDDPTLDWRRAFALPVITYFTHGLRWFAIQWPFPLLALAMALIAQRLTVKNDINSSEDQSVTTARSLTLYALTALVLASEFAYPLYYLFPSFEKIQQPYRFTAPAMLFASTALMISLFQRPIKERLRHDRCNPLFALGVAGGSIFITLMLQFGLANEGRPPPSMEKVMRGNFGQPEYIISTTGPHWKDYLLRGGWEGECQQKQVKCSNESRQSHAWSGTLVSAHPVVMRLPLFYFPAWSVRQNEIQIPTAADPDTGLIRLELPAGSSEIRVKWQGLPAERIGWWLFFAGVMLLVSLHYQTQLRHTLTRQGLLISQFSKFAAVGAIGTIAHYAILILMVSGFAISPVIGTSTGALFGALINYWLNHRYTFGSTASHRKALPRFIIMASVGLLLNALLVGLLIRLNLHYLAAQIVATGLVMLTNYIVSKAWIFQTPNSRNLPP